MNLRSPIPLAASKRSQFSWPTLSVWLRWAILLIAGGAAVAFIARDALRYVEYTPAAYRHHWTLRAWLIPHILAAGTAILVGPLQFLPRLRQRWPQWHRRAGWVYLLGAFIGAPAAFRLAIASQCVMCRPPLALLAALWFATAAIALFAAWRRDFATHRAFMIRSYVLMNAFVIIRLSDFVPLPIPADNARRAMFEWMCWVIPLGITEIWLTWRPGWRRKRASAAGI